MKIEYRSNVVVQLGTMNAGDVFKLDDRLYMKLYDPEKYNVIDLENGRLHDMSLGQNVLFVRAKVVVE